MFNVGLSYLHMRVGMRLIRQFFVLAALLASFAAQSAVLAAPIVSPTETAAVSKPSSLTEAMRVARFEEPLVATEATSSAEDAA